MKEKELVPLLRSLSKEELKTFGKYLRSPYFNNRGEIVRFYESVMSLYPDFSIDADAGERIFREVYKGRKHSDTSLRKLFSLTATHLINFLSVNNYTADPLRNVVYALEELRKRGLVNAFEKRSKQFAGILERSEKNLTYYEARYKFTAVANSHFLNSNERTMVQGFQNELDDFIEYLLPVLAHQYMRLEEWSKNYSINYRKEMLEEYISYFNARKKKEGELSELCFSMLMLLRTGEQVHYEATLRAREAIRGRLAKIDDFNTSVVLMQFCFKMISAGNTQYRKHQHSEALRIIEKGLIPDGFMNPYFFTNTIRNALLLGETSWSGNFIEQYRHRLNSDIAEEIVSYAYALMDFAKGSFESALSRFSNIRLDRLNMHLEARDLKLLIYYELGHINELYWYLDSYRHYLKRSDTVTPAQRSSREKFFGLISQIVRIKEDKGRNSAKAFIRELEGGPYFAYRDWLIEKAGEL